MTIVGYLTYPLAHKLLALYAGAVCGRLDASTVLICGPRTQGIQSFRAIQSPDPKDDKQWLTFWLLFGMFDLICFIADLLGWLIPFYDEAKVGFLVFMGFFEGAHLIYPRLEPLLLQGDEVAKKYEPLVQQHAQKIKEMAEAKAKEMTKKE